MVTLLAIIAGVLIPSSLFGVFCMALSTVRLTAAIGAATGAMTVLAVEVRDLSTKVGNGETVTQDDLDGMAQRLEDGVAAVQDALTLDPPAEAPTPVDNG